MPPEIVIRRERPDQAEVVALLGALDAHLAELYPPEANHILAMGELLAPTVRFFVAREAGRAVGTAALRLMPGAADSGGERYGELKRMYVEPALRGRHLGVGLLSALETALREEDVRLALLETGRDQHQALRLYSRCGYLPRAAFGGYPDNGLSVFYGKAL